MSSTFFSLVGHDYKNSDHSPECVLGTQKITKVPTETLK